MKSLGLCAALVLLVSGTGLDAQATKKRAPATRTAPAAPTMTRVAAEVSCPSDLGVGVKTRRRYCDVLTGRDPKEGVIVTIPPHRGVVTLSFELHNRHMYSEELIKAKRAFRQYTATIGVLSMDNTLVDRAVVRSEFRTADDLVDRIEASPGATGVKAVAPAGSEMVRMQLPADIGEQVSVLGESLQVKRPDGEDNFTAPGRPVATISNVMIEYQPAPARPASKTPSKKAPARRPPA
jgi:hypothetical protein